MIGVIIDEAVTEEPINVAGKLDVERFTDALIEEKRGVAEAVNRSGIRPDVGEGAFRDAEGGALDRSVVNAGRDHRRVDERASVETEIGAAGGSDAVDGTVAAEIRGLHHAGVTERSTVAFAGRRRNDPCIGADARGAERRLARKCRGLDAGVNGFAVPTGEGVREGVHAGDDFLFIVIPDDCEASVACDIESERGRHATALGVLPIAPRVRVLPGGDDARGDFIFQRIVSIDGGAVRFPGADLSANLGRIAADACAFHNCVGRAADRAGTKENGIRAARVVHALEIVRRSVGTTCEKITVRGVGTDTANRAGASTTKELAAAVVGRRSGADRPVYSFVKVAQIERIEKLTRLNRISDRCIDEIRSETTASERAGGDESLVARGINLKRRKFDRGCSGRLGRCDGGGLGLELRPGQGREEGDKQAG